MIVGGPVHMWNVVGLLSWSEHGGARKKFDLKARLI